MSPHMSSYLPLIFLASSALAQRDLYQPCPVFGPQFPVPTLDATSPLLEGALSQFEQIIENYTATGDGYFGPITPNITSFSIGFFAGDNYIPDEKDLPYFFDYSFAATGVTPTVAASADSQFALGPVTEVLTVLATLIDLGDVSWGKSIVEYLPELKQQASSLSPFDQVPWEDVTLGSLAGQLSGIPYTSDACSIDAECAKSSFLSALANKPALYLPDTTPIASNAAFQLLVYALEAECGQSFADLLASRIFLKTNMTNTGLLNPSTSLFNGGFGNNSVAGEPAALGAFSTTADMASLGRAILQSKLISQASTRRWFKPVTSTSNLVNSVSRPWDIYHSGGNAKNATASVLDIYTKSGTVGRYASYFGFVPDYDIGFIILAVNSEGEAPDLNAYADLASLVLLDLNDLTRAQATQNFAGNYSTVDSSMTLQIDDDQPGMVLESLTVNGTDWRAEIAKQTSIAVEDLDIRLYPSIPGSLEPKGQMQIFQAVIQDANALVDAGTPTCVSWQTMGQIERSGLPIDRWTFVLGADGAATSVQIPALGVTLARG